MYYDKPWGI
jgi:hypothetical protein